MLFRNRFVVVGAALAALTLLFLAWNQTTQVISTASVEHTNEVIDHSQKLLTEFVDAETGERGYLITGLDTYLEPYQRASHSWPAEMQFLRRLAAGNPDQQERLAQLDVLAKDKLSELAETIRLYRQGGKEAAWQLVLSGRGKKSMDEIRVLVAVIQTKENQLLVEKQQRRAQIGNKINFGLVIGFSLSVIVLFAASYRRQKIKADKLQLETETKFRNMFEVSPFGIVTIDRGRTSIFDFNTAMCRNLGYTREEFSAMQLLDFVALPAKEFEANMVALEHMFAGNGAPIHFESKHRTKHGEIRDVLVTAVPLVFQGHQYYYSAYQDVTDRKQVDVALRESETQFRTLANAIPHLCWIAHADGAIFWYNQRWYDYTGTTAEQMVGWGWKAVHEQSLLPQIVERWQASVASGDPFEMAFPLLGADGSFRPFLTRVTPVRDANGRVTRWFGTNTDISEQRENEDALRSHTLQLEAANDTLERTSEALRISEHTVRSLFETASQGILTTNTEGRIVEANAMALTLFGYTRSELLGERVEQLLPETLRSRHIQHRAEYAKQPRNRAMGLGMDLLARRKDGSEFPVEISLSYVAGLAMALVSDISSRTQAAREREVLILQLKRSIDDKTALLQEVHHRVKNNLQIICSLLRMQAETVADKRTSAELTVSENRVMSMAMIHEHLYSHADMSSVDLGEYCRELVSQLFSAYSTSTLITHRLETTEIRLTMEQAIPCGLILNELITNALKYAYPGGEGEVRINLWSRENWIYMKVSDQGVGMRTGFDPTSSQSLGLTLVHLLTDQLNGELQIGSPPGASFTVRFAKQAINLGLSSAAALG
jgi:PAS domain S-box-containing protein